MGYEVMIVMGSKVSSNDLNDRTIQRGKGERHFTTMLTSQNEFVIMAGGQVDKYHQMKSQHKTWSPGWHHSWKVWSTVEGVAVLSMPVVSTKPCQPAPFSVFSSPPCLSVSLIRFVSHSSEKENKRNFISTTFFKPTSTDENVRNDALLYSIATH